MTKGMIPANAIRVQAATVNAESVPGGPYASNR